MKRPLCLNFSLILGVRKFSVFLTVVSFPGIVSEQTKIYEPRHEKTNISNAYAKTKTQISFAVTMKLISAFVFAT